MVLRMFVNGISVNDLLLSGVMVFSFRVVFEAIFLLNRKCITSLSKTIHSTLTDSMYVFMYHLSNLFFGPVGRNCFTSIS